ncbi:MAG TPA: DNA polymerase III subunit gamma/tau C-terminal domain-containing protein, partial [Oxalicibacterium sp.]|nr:DNA polymerase III subunit gamma/tau C-terminal domain-containing protein [Oxalicibacterium sp.]
AAPAMPQPSAPSPSATVLQAAQVPASFDQAPPIDLPDLPPAPPWDDEPGFAQSSAQKKTEQPAVAENAAPVSVASTASVASAGAVAESPAAPLPPYVPQPVPGLQWDGDWPTLAAALPVRGVVHQLAQQSELLKCEEDGNAFRFDLRIAVDGLLVAGSVDKLAAALTERFGKPARIVTSIGPVRYTANAQAQADRAERQREAEQAMQDDPFVQKLMREFGATIVPGSVRPV